MIPNYPYFGLPNYMRYVNPQIYANSNQSYNKSANTPTPSHAIYTNTNVSPRENYTSTNSLTHNVYTTSNPSTQRVYTGNNSTSESKESSYRNNNFSQDTSPLFSLFGLNLYFDDVLLICIIFFLYNENVNDPFLFFSLILLLLN